LEYKIDFWKDEKDKNPLKLDDINSKFEYVENFSEDSLEMREIFKKLSLLLVRKESLKFTKE